MPAGTGPAGTGPVGTTQAGGPQIVTPSDGKLAEKISVRNLGFFYGEYEALRNISLQLYDRRVMVFIGPPGCGKSTLLRVLNRIYDLYPKQRAVGEVLLGGRDIVVPGIDLNLPRARIGMAFQKLTPFPLSIYDNIAFGIRLYEQLPRAEINGRVEHALRRSALWDEVKDKLGQSGLSLPGDQQQRQCIARQPPFRNLNGPVNQWFAEYPLEPVRKITTLINALCIEEALL
jgi:phosphate transport system ATP-binding protein